MLVIISGPDKHSVKSARNQIKEIIKEAKSELIHDLKYTHFVSIPLNTPRLKDSFIKFKESVLNQNNLEVTGIVEELFSNPGKLHLTISMLILIDEEEKEEAIKALEHCKENIVR